MNYLLKQKDVAFIVNDNGFLLPPEEDSEPIMWLFKNETWQVGTTENAQANASKKSPYVPGKLTFLLTSQCNLACVYCYSKNDRFAVPEVSYSDACILIEHMCENTLLLGRRTLKVGFHGGGEPFCAFDLMVKIVDYAKLAARSRHLRLKIYCSSNGILEQSMLKWITENVDAMKLSFDGPPEIQNARRPLADGDSYLKVCSTFEYLDSCSFPYTVRMTVAPSQVPSLQQMAEHVLSVSRCTTLKIELESTSHHSRSWTSAFWESFAQLVWNIRDDALQGGRNITSFDAGVNPDYMQCGAWGDNLIVDGNRRYATCFKAPESDKGACISIDSYMVQEGAIVRQLRKAEQGFFAWCRKCFLLGMCSGGCLRDWHFENDIKPDQRRCDGLRLSHAKNFRKKYLSGRTSVWEG